MKKVLFFLIFAFVGFSLHALDLELTDFSVSMSPITFLSALPVTDEEGNPAVFVGLSLNFGSKNFEHDWFISLYPAVYSFGYEQRVFFNSEKKGFLYGCFASIDYRKFYLQPDGIKIEMTEIVDEEYFNTFGLRVGYEMGFRIRLDDFGITPKFGIGIPLYYPIGLEKISNDFVRDYFLTLVSGSIFIGLKFDFLDCSL